METKTILVLSEKETKLLREILLAWLLQMKKRKWRGPKRKVQKAQQIHDTLLTPMNTQEFNRQHPEVKIAPHEASSQESV
jgi:hypothetical protein|tara:strand:+ start:3340 stop:3579 length:240 start_codon:yes stop_codon:yes gene_type:complete